jgi:putative ABC transport system permease protein
MIKNYFKTAWRNLLRQKTLAFINVFGLSVGIAFFILLLLYSVNELSFDRFNKNAKNIYCVYDYEKGLEGNAQYTSITAMPLGPTMKKDMPDVINYVRLKQMPDEAAMRSNNEIHDVKISFTDPQFFSVFTFPLKYGNISTALKGLNSLVITSSKAKELFGTDDAIGKTVELKAPKDFQPFIITAVAGDMPANSSIHFDVMGSFAFLESTRFGAMFNNWYTTSFRTFVQLRAGSSLPNDVNRLATFHHTYNQDDATIKDGKSIATYGLLPLRSIHTETRINDITEVEAVQPKTIWIILCIASAILLIACINFTTLAIGRSAGRGREVGVRKVIGAERSQLIFQFLSEAFLLSVLSTIIGLIIVTLLLPYFNQLAGRNLQFSFSLYPEMSWLIVGVVALVAIFSGSYPALLLSRFKPIEVLKNKIRLGGSNVFTKSLVTLQFTLSIALIISTIIILQQTKYMTSKNPGFNKENVVVVDAEQTNTQKNYPLFKQALSTNTNILGIASSETSLGEGAEFQDHGFMYNGTHKTIYETLIDPDYIPVLGMQLMAGRNFNAETADDTAASVIINEVMMNKFGWTLNNVIGQQIKGYTDNKTPVVIGVVKNFNFQPLTEKIQPQLFHQFAGRPQKFFVRIKPGDPSTVITAIQKTWNSIAPDASFKYSFLDDDLDNFYKSEKRWSSIVGWAGGISIFLACLGLFGLAALTAVNRIKEIGIRKVMGASVRSITTLLSKDFLKLIIIALLIASPVAWVFMNKWLQSFAYRINIGWEVFVIAGLFVIVIALITISFQAIKAAIANPVKSLRTE